MSDSRASKLTYSEKLKDPRWQKKRLEVLKRDEFECVECGSKDETLHVHHRLYRKGLSPWEYAREDLITLCESCHKSVTNLRFKLDELAGSLNLDELEELVAFIDHTKLELNKAWANWLRSCFTFPMSGNKPGSLMLAECKLHNEYLHLICDAFKVGVRPIKSDQ